jgi:hypothetical protein
MPCDYPFISHEPFPFQATHPAQAHCVRRGEDMSTVGLGELRCEAVCRAERREKKLKAGEMTTYGSCVVRVVGY